MIFDLQGKRRRAVQATYLVLAVLMGGGLVLFGVGSGSINGGLFDAITGNGNGNGNANSAISKRIKRDNQTLATQPKNEPALADLVRSHYQLATDDADANTGAFGPKGKQELQAAASAWQRYLNVAKNPSDSLASLMVQAYGQGGLNKPSQAQTAAEIIARARPSAQTYLQLTQFATQAGDTRTAKLAGLKAIDLAPKSQKKLVKKEVAIASAVSTINPSQVTPRTSTGSGG